jgi:hypothetical protein
MPATEAPHRARLWGAVAVALLVPPAAMLAGAGLDWGAGDMLAFAALLIGAAGACELAASRLTGRSARRRAAAAIALVTLLVWAELAVGLVGPG